jgi:hypothetical protein
MLALHRGRTALTLACLLTTTAFAASAAPDAHALLGQVGTGFGQYGEGVGQFSPPAGIAARAGQLFVADTQANEDGDGTFRIQRFDATTRAPLDTPLWDDDVYFGADSIQNGGQYVYTGDLAADPRSGQSHLYVLLRPQDQASNDPKVTGHYGGKVIEVDADTPTGHAAGKSPVPKGAFPLVSGKGTLNYPGGLAVSPVDGEILVGDYDAANDDARPVVRRFQAAGAHAADATIQLKDADNPPSLDPDRKDGDPPRVDGTQHDSVTGVAVRADGTIAVLSVATPLECDPVGTNPDNHVINYTNCTDTTDPAHPVVKIAPAGIPQVNVVDVYSPALAHLASFRPGGPRTKAVAFTPAGKIAVSDAEAAGGVQVYDPASATPGTPVSRFGTLTQDDAPGQCELWSSPDHLALAGGFLYASDAAAAQVPHPVRARVVQFGDPGRGCGPKITDASISLSRTPVTKGSPVTFTGTAADTAGPLADGAYSWTIDGQAYTGKSVTTTFATTGNKDVVLTVDNGSTSRTVRQTVPVSGQAPVAAFTIAGNGGTAPAAMTFDASGSSDPDGTIQHYGWDLNGDGADDADGKVVQATFSAAGTYSVRLIVTDDDGQKTTVRKSVTVAAPPNPGGGGGGGGNPGGGGGGGTTTTPGGGGGTTTTPTQIPPVGGQSSVKRPGKASISLGGALTPDAKGKVKVKLSCPASSSGCSGTLTIATSGKKPITFATGRYTVKAGGATTVTLKLSSASLAKLKKLKRAAIVVTAKGGATATAKGTIKAPKKAKH